MWQNGYSDKLVHYVDLKQNGALINTVFNYM